MKELLHHWCCCAIPKPNGRRTSYRGLLLWYVVCHYDVDVTVDGPFVWTAGVFMNATGGPYWLGTQRPIHNWSSVACNAAKGKGKKKVCIAFNIKEKCLAVVSCRRHLPWVCKIIP